MCNICQLLNESSPGHKPVVGEEEPQRGVNPLACSFPDADPRAHLDFGLVDLEMVRA